MAALRGSTVIIKEFEINFSRALIILSLSFDIRKIANFVANIF